MSRALVRLFVVVAVVSAAPPVWAQFCAPTADPCVVNASITVPGDTTVDLGARAFVIEAGRVITVQGTGTGALSISAGDITFQDGARIVASGPVGSGGAVTLLSSGAVVMGLNSRIDTAGASGGDVLIIAATAVLDGQLRAVATTREGIGGYITVSTAGGARVGGGGFLSTGGNLDGFGGDIDVVAGGDLEVAAVLDARGGDGGDISVEAFGNLTAQATSVFNNQATTAGGYGGDLYFTAGGTASLAGPVLTRGAGSLLEGGGDGGFVDVYANSALIGAQFDLSGAGPDGSGGFLDITTTGDVTIGAPLVLTGAAQAAGGDVMIDATGRITVAASIDATGGSAGGSFESITRDVFVLAPGAVVNVAGGYGGDAVIEACQATIAGTLDASGLTAPGRALVWAIVPGTLTVSGTIKGPNGVTFTYRTQPPTIMPSASIAPAPTLVSSPTLPCCASCTTTTSTSSTTSTTTQSSTTTTSSSSTTVATVPPTTTSVTEPSTSSTSSSSSSSSTSSSASDSTSTSSSSTVTTTTVAASTTSTSLPLSCIDEPLEGYAAVECAVTYLQDRLSVQNDDALGGRKNAKRLAGKVSKTWTLVEKSRTSRKAAKLLVKAGKKVASFETQIARLVAKTKIDDGLATDLLELSGEISVRINGVLTPLAN